jgi:hypothetical protein
MKLARMAILAALIGAVSCGRAPAEELLELQRVRSGDVDVVLLSDDGSLTHGKDTFLVEFRRASNGELVDIGTVKAGANMPMAGLPAMLGSVFLEKTETPGRYSAETDLSMSGGWNLQIDWNGPLGKGSASFQATAD